MTIDLSQFGFTSEEVSLVQMFIDSERMRNLLSRVASGPVEVAAMRLEGVDNEEIDMILRAGAVILRCLVQHGVAIKMMLEQPDSQG